MHPKGYDRRNKAAVLGNRVICRDQRKRYLFGAAVLKVWKVI